MLFIMITDKYFDVNKPTVGVLLQCFKVSPPWVWLLYYSTLKLNSAAAMETLKYKYKSKSIQISA